jgi:hypothetical protein
MVMTKLASYILVGRDYRGCHSKEPLKWYMCANYLSILGLSSIILARHHDHHCLIEAGPIKNVSCLLNWSGNVRS